MQIYVGNLPTSYSDEQLKEMFAPYGTVRAATIGRNKKTGESEGYGFVDMPVKSEARVAIEALRGKEIEGKPLRVRALKPGDEFHQLAYNLHASSQKTPKGFSPARQPRASGAIRRGGQRGT
ncbi:MAG TPA: RNA-binding protein [Bacteroidota bacterium]|nr:RNA-binding protein [Bacteroidota bacterium]